MNYIASNPSADKLRTKSGKTAGLCVGRGIVNFAKALALCDNRREKITARGFSDLQGKGHSAAKKPIC